MNPSCSISCMLGVTKPRSRGDEPVVGGVITYSSAKTPLTRG